MASALRFSPRCPPAPSPPNAVYLRSWLVCCSGWDIDGDVVADRAVALGGGFAAEGGTAPGQPGVVALAPARQELAEDFTDDGAAVVRVRAGRDLPADRTEGDRVGDPVRVQVLRGGFSGVSAGGMDELAGREECPDFLPDHVRVPGPQDAAGASQDRFEFAVSGFGFPPLRVALRDLLRRCLHGVQQAGDQPVRFAVAGAVRGG